MNSPYKIALAGIGEIAVEQHLPTIAASPDWELVATCSRSGTIAGVTAYTDIEEMLTRQPEITVVSLCQPPKPRYQFAVKVLNHNRHVMLEKPTGATIAECLKLEALAKQRKLALFGTWHSREADMVDAVRLWLANKKLRQLTITWREDVRRWHAGQEWIWQPGGFGVLDPGINALSIVTRILPDAIHVSSARLEVPENKQTPIAAQLTFQHPHGAEVTADFDWRETGEQSWIIVAETDNGVLQLCNGGSELFIDGELIESTDAYQMIADDQAVNTLGNEYRRLYSRMAKLVEHNETDMDLAPLHLVADAFMVGEHTVVEPFYDSGGSYYREC